MKNKKRVKAAEQHLLVASTRQSWAHRDTIVVARHRELLEFKRKQVEDSIAALQHAVAREKINLADTQAQIQGLTLVIERR